MHTYIKLFSNEDNLTTYTLQAATDWESLPPEENLNVIHRKSERKKGHANMLVIFL